MSAADASLPPLPPLPPLPVPVSRATVHAGATATDYLRAGCGPPVLLLGDASAGEGGRGLPLLAALATRFRVIVPTLPADGATAFSAWLRGVLDGLGIASARVVAEEGCALRALSFALTDPARVERVALVFRDLPDPSLTGGALPELLGRSGHPLLVRCAPEGCSAAAVDDVVRFLD